MLNLQTIRAVLFDMDGVLYRGSRRLDGAVELLQFLQQSGIAVACITNNASMSPQQYEEKLHGMGLMLRGGQVLTSALVTARYLRGEYPTGTRVSIVGMRGLREALLADGWFVEDNTAPELVVQGADFELTYATLKRATLLLRAGARFIATNPDLTFPSEEGLIPGAGSIMTALSAASGVTPLVIGKPAPTMFTTAAEMLLTDAAQTLVIGDRLDTDIAGALAAGMPSVMVLTGVSTAQEAAAGPIRPTAVYDDLPALLADWQQQLG